MPFAIDDLYDQTNGTAPLRWGENAVADGIFSSTEGLVWVDAIQATVVSWSHTSITFVPVRNARPNGTYTIHIDNVNEPIIPEFRTHPNNLSLDETKMVMIAEHVSEQGEVQEVPVIIDHLLDGDHVQQQGQITEGSIVNIYLLDVDHIRQQSTVTEPTVVLESNPVGDHIQQQSQVTEGACNFEANLTAEHIQQQGQIEQGAVDIPLIPLVFETDPQDITLSPTYEENNLTSQHISEQGQVEQGAVTQLTSFNFVTDPEDITLAPTTNQYIHDFTVKALGNWTHTRASNATAPDEFGVIQTYTTDQPAWYRDQGLQLEDARTNYIPQSAALTGWTPRTGGSGSTDGALIAPDGSTGTSVYTSTASLHGWRYLTTIDVVDTVIAPSIYVYFKQRPTDNDPDFRLRNPATTSRGRWDFKLATIPTDQWHLVNESSNWWSGADWSCNGANDGIGFAQVNGTTTLEVGYWGAQVEIGAFSTSSIPTSGSTYTRAATQCTATFAELGSPLPAGGVTNDFCGQIKLYFTVPLAEQDAWLGLLAISQGTSSSNRLEFSHDNSGIGNLRVTLNTTNGTFASNIAYGNGTAGATLDLRFRVSSTSGVSVWVDGVKSDWPAETYSTAAAMQLVNIGTNRSGTNNSYVVANKLRLVPEALTDEEIEAWD